MAVSGHRTVSVMLFLLLFSGLCTLPFTFGQCDAGWSQFESRCFKVMTTPADFNTSEQNCVSMGGHLASVHSSTEYTFFQSLIVNATGTNSQTWLGGTDVAQEGVWVWTDYSLFNYTNWYSGEPDNFQNIQNCLVMNFLDPLQWDDDTCTRTFISLCAKTAATPATSVPSTILTSTSFSRTSEYVVILRLKLLSTIDFMNPENVNLALEKFRNLLTRNGVPSNFTFRVNHIYKSSP